MARACSPGALAYPWLAQLGPLARPLPLLNLLDYREAVVGALGELGVLPARVLDLHILLYSHGQGLGTWSVRRTPMLFIVVLAAGVPASGITG